MVNKLAQNILYILPTREWSTRERFAYRDILLAKNQGYGVYLCTYENSFLAKMVQREGVEVIPFKEHFLNSMTVFHKHLSLRSILKKIKFDIVHCYDFNFLFSLSIQLKTENLTALVITQDHIIDKPLQRFWYKPLISRIDALILADKNLRPDAQGNLDLLPKKNCVFWNGLKA